MIEGAKTTMTKMTKLATHTYSKAVTVDHAGVARLYNNMVVFTHSGVTPEVADLAEDEAKVMRITSQMFHDHGIEVNPTKRVNFKEAFFRAEDDGIYPASTLYVEDPAATLGEIEEQAVVASILLSWPPFYDEDGEPSAFETYVLPSDDHTWRSCDGLLSVPRESVAKFLAYATDRPEEVFFISRAWGDPAPFALAPSNCRFPESWRAAMLADIKP